MGKTGGLAKDRGNFYSTWNGWRDFSLLQDHPHDYAGPNARVPENTCLTREVH